MLLGFNEPDLAGQSNMTVDAALDLWPQLQATGQRLGSPAVGVRRRRPRAAGSTSSWPARAQRGYRVDFIALHWYGSDFCADRGRAAARLPAGGLRPLPHADLADRVRADRLLRHADFPTQAQQAAFITGVDGDARGSVLPGALRVVRAADLDRRRPDRPLPRRDHARPRPARRTVRWHDRRSRGSRTGWTGTSRPGTATTRPTSPACSPPTPPTAARPTSPATAASTRSWPTGWPGRTQPGETTFTWRPVAVTDDVAVIEGTTTYPTQTFRNLWVIRLGPDGRCSEFTEWWMEVPSTVD